jgi:hypothetical protein
VLGGQARLRLKPAPWRSSLQSASWVQIFQLAHWAFCNFVAVCTRACRGVMHGREYALIGKPLKATDKRLMLVRDRSVYQD